MSWSHTNINQELPHFQWKRELQPYKRQGFIEKNSSLLQLVQDWHIGMSIGIELKSSLLENLTSFEKAPKQPLRITPREL